MARLADKVDGILGRLVFRTMGVVCAIVALISVFAVWSHLSDWKDYSLVPTILFAILAIAAGSCVPYCFSRKRTFIEALDAMEGGVGDARKWEKPGDRR